MIWTGYQYGIGDIMMVRGEGKNICLTYPEFCQKWDSEKAFRY